MQDENGRWVTINGTHIFIKDGQTLEQAMAERFDESDWQDESKPTFDDYDIKSDLDIEEFKQTTSKKLFRGVLDASYKETKERLKSQYNQHEVLNPELEGIVGDMIAKRVNVQKLWAKDEYTGGGTYYSRYKHQVVMNVNYGDEWYQTMDNLFHESGHALDNTVSGEYSSSRYVSKKYDKTLAEILKEEISEVDIDAVLSECERLQDLRKSMGELRDNGTIDKTKARNERARYASGRLSIIDVIQGTFGYDFVMEKFDTWTHQKYYFDPVNGYKDTDFVRTNRGTEFFAEMTCDLICDREHNFSNFMKKIAPKAVEIYYEILEDKYGYKQK